MVVRRSDTRTPSKPPLKTSTFQQSHGNRLHKIVQSDEASWKGELVNTKQTESAKPNRNVHSRKPELRHHQQSFLPQTFLVLSAAGSLELRLVSSAILEHTNNNTSHSWLGLVIVRNDRRTGESVWLHLVSVKILCKPGCDYSAAVGWIFFWIIFLNGILLIRRK